MMQQGALVGAYANAVQDAAKNENGAGTGFVGVGMMNMASGGMVGGAVNAPFQNAAPNQTFQAVDPYQQQPAAVNTEASPSVEAPENQEVKPKFCSNCGNPVTGNFCSNCGTKVE